MHFYGSCDMHVSSSADYSRLTSMHFYAWEKGLKTGVYYLRSRAATEAIMFTVSHAGKRDLPRP